MEAGGGPLATALSRGSLSRPPHVSRHSPRGFTAAGPFRLPPPAGPPTARLCPRAGPSAWACEVMARYRLAAPSGTAGLGE